MPLMLQKQKDEEQEGKNCSPTHTTFTPLTIFNKFDFLGGWVGFPFFPFFGVPFHFSRTFIIPLGVKMSRFFQIISFLQLAVTVYCTHTFVHNTSSVFILCAAIVVAG